MALLQKTDKQGRSNITVKIKTECFLYSYLRTLIISTNGKDTIR